MIMPLNLIVRLRTGVWHVVSVRFRVTVGGVSCVDMEKRLGRTYGLWDRACAQDTLVNRPLDLFFTQARIVKGGASLL